MLAFLTSAEKGCESARFALRSEYGDFAGSLFGPVLGGSEGGEKGMRATVKESEERLAARMIVAILSKTRRFTVAVTGQSNAAGHGSYFDE